MSAQAAATVQLCGKPELALFKDVAQVSVLLRSSDPDSAVHAEIRVLLRADGHFWFEGEWLLTAAD